jgi:hypothetical protein
VARRLDRLSRQGARLERELWIAAETLALFIRFWLTVTPPLPEGAQVVAQAKGVSASIPSCRRRGDDWRRAKRSPPQLGDFRLAIPRLRDRTLTGGISSRRNRSGSAAASGATICLTLLSLYAKCDSTVLKTVLLKSPATLCSVMCASAPIRWRRVVSFGGHRWSSHGYVCTKFP